MEPVLQLKEDDLVSDNKYAVKTVSLDGQNLVNICDKEILGTIAKDDKREVHISKEYFGGEVVGVKDALAKVQESSIANIAGKNIIKEVINAKMASKSAIKKVGQISFLIIMKVSS